MKKIIFCFISLLVLIGCEEDAPLVRQLIPLGQTQVNLQFRSEDSEVSQEATVNSLDIYVFRDGLLEFISQNTIENESGVSFLLKEGGIRSFYLIANNTSKPAVVIGETTQGDFKKIESALLASMPAAPFIMSGVREDVRTTVDTALNLDCELSRLVAKVEVKSVNEDFVIESVALRSSPLRSYIFGQDVPLDDQYADFDDVALADEAALYSYENMNAEQSKATYLVVKGLDKGAPREYKVEFKDKQDHPIAIERNSLYQVNIDKSSDSHIGIEIKIKDWVLFPDTIKYQPQENIEVTQTLDPMVTFTPLTKTFDVRNNGGNIVLDVAYTNPIEVIVSDSWIQVQKSENRFTFTVDPNVTSDVLKGTIILRDELNPTILLEYNVVVEVGVVKQKFMVVVVAGQSNSVGYDESPIDPLGVDAVDPHVFQLGIYGEDNLKVIPLTHNAQNLQNMSSLADKNGVLGTKGIHLPLGQELLKRVPAGYDILVISVAYGNTGFTKGVTGSYDTQGKKPVANANLRWGKGSPYYKTMIDRVKHVLDLDVNNKFLGVVWCQGERDQDITDEHYGAFDAMVNSFTDEINGAGYGSRCPRGIAGKHIWYNYSSTSYWNALTKTPGRALFGGYKIWNPDTFIRIPDDTDTNAINGTGKTSSIRTSHFGNNAFRKVIAPLVVRCMDRNGGLFNGAAPTPQFVNEITRAEALAKTGNLGNADIQQGLMCFLGFDNPNNITQNGAIATAMQIDSKIRTGLFMSNDMIDIDGSLRSRYVLETRTGLLPKLTMTTANKNNSNFSFSFMYKNSADQTASSAILGGNTNAPFIALHSYANDKVAGMRELMVEPSSTSTPNVANAGFASIFYADNMREYAGWVHYAGSYNKDTKQLKLYMNGMIVFDKIMTGMTNAPDLSNLTLNITSAISEKNGCFIADFYLWDRVVSTETLTKTYIMSYYGLTK